MENFKVGDLVQRINGQNEGVLPGEICEILSVSSDGKYVTLNKGLNGNNHSVDNLLLVKQTNNKMNIKEKFALALTKEPMKSFRKAGITNGDDLLTDDGMKVFLSWLLNKKFSEEFKTDVVDDMLEDLKKEGK